MFSESFRPKSISPKYPPYHKGMYLEEYFYTKWNEENIKTDREYIDIFWTNIFCNMAFSSNSYLGIQKELDNILNKNKKYFTICQFDDGPLETFPQDTLIFSAGGNRRGNNVIPIPLICSSISKEMIPINEKKYFASFVGSRNTHWVRTDMYSVCKSYNDYKLNTRNWDVNVSGDLFNNFLNITTSSKFCLCPRGYGTSSFRLYEAFQCGVVPVYISDIHDLPWNDELNWNEFCVIIHDDQIKDIDNILKSISDKKYNSMIRMGNNLYEDYFSLDGVYKNIIKRIK